MIIFVSTTRGFGTLNCQPTMSQCEMFMEDYLNTFPHNPNLTTRLFLSP